MADLLRQGIESRISTAYWGGLWAGCFDIGTDVISSFRSSDSTAGAIRSTQVSPALGLPPGVIIAGVFEMATSMPALLPRRDPGTNAMITCGGLGATSVG